jgi:hypothetical protein
MKSEREELLSISSVRGNKGINNNDDNYDNNNNNNINAINTSKATTERLERSNNLLKETISLGRELIPQAEHIIVELDAQESKLRGMVGKTKDINGNLQNSNSILKSMRWQAVENKRTLLSIALLLLCVILIILYLKYNT